MIWLGNMRMMSRAAAVWRFELCLATTLICTATTWCTDDDSRDAAGVDSARTCTHSI
jgi:hypothetical protein